MNIIWGSTSKPESSKLLAEYFSHDDDDESTLYIGYPILSGLEHGNTVDALLLSKTAGVVAIQIIEGRNLTEVESVQEDIYSKLYSRLFSNRKLSKKRQPLFSLEIATFAPIQKQNEFNEDYPVFSTAESLKKWIKEIPPANQDIYNLVVSTIQSLTNIRGKRAQRATEKDNSKAAILNRLDDSIANLDARQSSAVIETIEGIQRIRGLAGSGKTIILALKVAYLHASEKDWNIAVTFNTRSLKGMFERLINTFYIDQTGEEPDWNKIHILHAWGSAGDTNRGIYYEACINSGAEYLDFGVAKYKFGYDNAFDGACKSALEYIENKKVTLVPTYDAILIDEAQDFSGSFLKLCHLLLTDQKRLVYAYDELQTLDEKTLPSPEELFSTELTNIDGQPKKDIILEKCYRNSRQILTAAHSLGFGIYTDDNHLVQMFDNSSLWSDIGYAVTDGELQEGSMVQLERTRESSPEFLENHSPEDDLIQFKSWPDNETQEEWIVSEIEKNITEDDLRPEDIVVINPNPLTTRDSVGAIRSKLLAKGIDSSLVGVSSSRDTFTSAGKVSFTGIHRAKGNEAGIVYIINAHYCYKGSGLAKKRNILFTAMTRAKAWLRVSGVGDSMIGLHGEFTRLRENDYKLKFTYPTKEEREHLRLINRDLSTEEKRIFNKKKAEIERSIESLNKGEITIDDLSDEALANLRNLLK